MADAANNIELSLRTLMVNIERLENTGALFLQRCEYAKDAAGTALVDQKILESIVQEKVSAIAESMRPSPFARLLQKGENGFQLLSKELNDIGKFLESSGADVEGHYSRLIAAVRALDRELAVFLGSLTIAPKQLRSSFAAASRDGVEELEAIRDGFDQVFTDGLSSISEFLEQLAGRAESIVCDGVDAASDALPSLLDLTVDRIVENVIEAVSAILSSSLELTTLCQSLSTTISPYLPQLVAIRELAIAVRELLEMARAGL